MAPASRLHTWHNDSSRSTYKRSHTNCMDGGSSICHKHLVTQTEEQGQTLLQDNPYHRTLCTPIPSMVKLHRPKAVQSAAQILASTPARPIAAPVGVKRKRGGDMASAKRQRPRKTARFQYKKRDWVMPISKTQKNEEQVFLESCCNCKDHANRAIWPTGAKITLETCTFGARLARKKEMRQMKIDPCEGGLRAYMSSWKSHLNKYHAKGFDPAFSIQTSLAVADGDLSEDEEAEETEVEDPEDFVD
ncbi:hypothetical protein BDW69DRAFT_185457 [Aspergillus filifer]